MSDLADKQEAPAEAPKIPTAPAAEQNVAAANLPASNGKALEIPDELNPAKMLQEWLDKNGLEMRLTPPNVRPMQDGGLLIDPPQVAVSRRGLNPAIPADKKN